MTDYQANLRNSSLMAKADLGLEGNPQINITRQVVENPAATRFYLMRAIDADCGSITYRTWVVRGKPDTDAILYSGTKCGSSALQQIVIASTWIIED